MLSHCYCDICLSDHTVPVKAFRRGFTDAQVKFILALNSDNYIKNFQLAS